MSTAIMTRPQHFLVRSCSMDPHPFPNRPADEGAASPGPKSQKAPSSSTTLWLPRERRQLGIEVWIIVGLSLGKSAVYAILSLLDKLTTTVSLGSQSTSLNNSVNSKEWLDLIYQVVDIAFALLPVALALYLLRDAKMPGWARIGLTWHPARRNIGRGFALAALIGIPGLAFYGLGRLMGITVNVVAANLGEHWWTIPILLA